MAQTPGGQQRSVFCADCRRDVGQAFAGGMLHEVDDAKVCSLVRPLASALQRLSLLDLPPPSLNSHQIPSPAPHHRASHLTTSTTLNLSEWLDPGQGGARHTASCNRSRGRSAGSARAATYLTTYLFPLAVGAAGLPRVEMATMSSNVERGNGRWKARVSDHQLFYQCPLPSSISTSHTRSNLPTLPIRPQPICALQSTLLDLPSELPSTFLLHPSLPQNPPCPGPPPPAPPSP